MQQRVIVRELLGVWTKKFHIRKDQAFSYRSFSSDVTAAILVYQNNEMAAILVYGTGISSFLFKYFVLFHHPTGATDHVSENDLLNDMLVSCQVYPRSQGLSAARVLLIFNEWPSENGSGDENVRSGEKISKYESDKKC